MADPTDYTQLPTGLWIKDSDGTGPYVRTAVGTFDLMGTASGSGGGGASTVADGADVALGATTDTAASSDTGAFSLIALVKLGTE